MPEIEIQTCPLCSSKSTVKFEEDRMREYFQCGNCNLIFVPSKYYMSSDDEKTRYDEHKNNPKDTGYTEFLMSIFDPVNNLIALHSKGLDFGSGPGPILSNFFRNAGHSMEDYDLYYANKPELFDNEYEFITATEVIEHTFNPMMEIERLWSCLKPDGVLGIMTNLYTENIHFKSWYYKNDKTHICFFTKETFEWIANVLNARISFFDKDIIILQKG